MGLTTIEWTDRTWNPWHGCHKISPGCKFCYMFRDKARYGQDANTVVRSKTTFYAPLSWPKQPMMCFTCSWSDWFIEEADAWRDDAYTVIEATPWITYQILTKRADRMAGRVPDPPLPNIWFGVSAETQPFADLRIPQLLQIPATVHFVSYEPALGPLDLIDRPTAGNEECRRNWLTGDFYNVRFVNQTQEGTMTVHTKSKVDWVIVGGESGPDARPFDVHWATTVIEQCEAAGVSCFVKQLGARPMYRIHGDNDPRHLFNGLQPLFCNGEPLKDRKGGTMEEWPHYLCVRQFPKTANGVHP